MKKISLIFLVAIALCFVSFNQQPAKQNQNCSPVLYASNQSGTTAKLYRVTYYPAGGCGQDVSQVVNLSNGQSVILSSACIGNEISVLVKNGTFNYVSVERSDGTDVIASTPYDGSQTYWLHNVNFPDCGSDWTVVLH